MDKMQKTQKNKTTTNQLPRLNSQQQHTGLGQKQGTVPALHTTPPRAWQTTCATAPAGTLDIPHPHTEVTYRAQLALHPSGEQRACCLFSPSLLQQGSMKTGLVSGLFFLLTGEGQEPQWAWFTGHHNSDHAEGMWTLSALFTCMGAEHSGNPSLTSAGT